MQFVRHAGGDRGAGTQTVLTLRVTMGFLSTSSAGPSDAASGGRNDRGNERHTPGASPAGSVFHRLLDAFFEGRADEQTLGLIAGGEHPSRRLSAGRRRHAGCATSVADRPLALPQRRGRIEP
jgi:hypothetical protein